MEDSIELLRDIGNTNSKDMGNTFFLVEMEPMPWKGVTVTEQRQRFLEDSQLNYYSIAELAERFFISRKTTYYWINIFKHNSRYKLRAKEIQGMVSKVACSLMPLA